MKRPLASTLAVILPVATFATTSMRTQAQVNAAEEWAGCCGLAHWAEPGPLMASPQSGAGPLFSGYAYLVGGSALRHHFGVAGQIPEPYRKLRNPLAPTPQNAGRGAAIYEVTCASCHGASGLGDGPAALSLDPKPAHLGWLKKVSPSQRDSFLYWSVADGGEVFKTGMPSYKDKLSSEQIWSVIGYIQARLPKENLAAR